RLGVSRASETPAVDPRMAGTSAATAIHPSLRVVMSVGVRPVAIAPRQPAGAAATDRLGAVELLTNGGSGRGLARRGGPREEEPVRANGDRLATPEVGLEVDRFAGPTRRRVGLERFEQPGDRE